MVILGGRAFLMSEVPLQDICCLLTVAGVMRLAVSLVCWALNYRGTSLIGTRPPPLDRHSSLGMVLR